MDTSKFEHFLQLVLDNVPAFIFWKDIQSVYLGCNNNYALALGLNNPKEILGKTDFDFWPDEYAQSYIEDDRRVIESGDPKIRYEEPAILYNGDQIWVETTKVPLRDKQKKIIGVLGIYHDITDKKREEEHFNQILKDTKEHLGNQLECIQKLPK